MKYKFTQPKIYKGAKPKNIPKSSTIKKEWAKQTWYINLSFDGKQYRIKKDLNKIKDYDQKLLRAEAMVEFYKEMLNQGFKPNELNEYTQIRKENNITIENAVYLYIEELKTYARSKTVQSYLSKLRYLINYYPNKEINSFKPQDLERYINIKIKGDLKTQIYITGKYHEYNQTLKWTPNTVKAAKGIFRAFFNWCISKGYFNAENPAGKMESKKIRSEVPTKLRNIPFSVEDCKKIFLYLDECEPLTAFVCRFIYYTCIRPGELAALKIKDIDINNRQIVVPLSVSKNTKRTKEERILLDNSIFEILLNLNITTCDQNHYIVSNNNTIFGATPRGSNVPYKKLKKALKHLNLEDKGYNLYSFKHYGNIQRYNSGWTMAEIMKVNRHTTLTMTENYLKNITLNLDISEKKVPQI